MNEFELIERIFGKMQALQSSPNDVEKVSVMMLL